MGSADFSIEKLPDPMVPVAPLQLHQSALPWQQVGDEHHLLAAAASVFSRESQICNLKSPDGTGLD